MMEAVEIILCVLGVIVSLWLIGYGLKKLGTHKWMTKDDYRQLNKKAKRVHLVHQEYKKHRPKPQGFWQQMTDPSSLPEPIRRVL